MINRSNISRVPSKKRFSTMKAFASVVFPVTPVNLKPTNVIVSRKVSNPAIDSRVDTRFLINSGHGKIPVINPHCKYMKKWDLIMICLLIFIAVVSPFETAFLDGEIGFLFFINRLVDLLFLKDLIMRFFLMYYDELTNRWISDPSTIQLNYLKRWSFIPFDLISLVSNAKVAPRLQLARIFRLFRLIKLTRLLKSAQIFRRWETKLRISYGMLSLVKFGLSVIMLAHWIACLFRMTIDLETSTNSKGEKLNWSTEFLDLDRPISESSPIHQYVAALYWSVMTLTTIGYGDIIPRTHGERMVCILCMFIGGGTYAYVVGGVCQIVNSMDESSNTFQRTIDTLNNYMKQYQIPLDLRSRLREFFHSSRVLQREKHYHELLLSMSPGLRGEVSLHNNRWVHQISFFQCDNTAEKMDFFTELCLLLRAQFFGPNEKVIRVGEYNTKMFLVQRGIASKRGLVYNRGSFFGEDIVLHLRKRSFTVIAVNYLHVQILYKKDLDSLLSTGCYPETMEKIRKQVIKTAFQRKFVRYAELYKKAGYQHNFNKAFTKSSKKKEKLVGAIGKTVLSNKISSTFALMKHEIKTINETQENENETDQIDNESSICSQENKIIIDKLFQNVIKEIKNHITLSIHDLNINIDKKINKLDKRLSKIEKKHLEKNQMKENSDFLD